MDEKTQNPSQKILEKSTKPIIFKELFGQIIIFHQPGFPWNSRGFPLQFTTIWGKSVVWGRYNLTRRIVWPSSNLKNGRCKRLEKTDAEKPLAWMPYTGNNELPISHQAANPDPKYSKKNPENQVISMYKSRYNFLHQKRYVWKKKVLSPLALWQVFVTFLG